MTPVPPSASLPAKVWGALTSLRLTVVLLFVLAVLGLVGTVRSRVFDTWWFLAPLGLFAVNLTSCLINGFPQALRRAGRRLTPETARELPERARFTWPSDTDPQVKVEKALSRELGRMRRVTEGDQELYLYERGRWRPVGPYIVHLALLFILAGAVVGKFWGVDGSLSITEGETAQSFEVTEGEVKGQTKALPLPFKVRLDRFQVLYYPEGDAVREYRSDLTFLKPGAPDETAICRVNEPVTFDGLTFYQSSYGEAVRLEIKEGESTQAVVAPLRRDVTLSGGQARVRLLAYTPDLVMPGDNGDQHLGPAARLAYWDGSGHPQLVVVLQNRPEMADKQPGPHRFFLKGSNSFSVLKVKWDPGVPWVYLGFILLLPGFYLAFLRPPERWALVVRQGKQGVWEASLKGAAPRSRETFQARLERLQNLLKGGGKT